MRVRRGVRGLIVGLGVLAVGAASAAAAGLGGADRWLALSAAGTGGVAAAFAPSLVSALLGRQRKRAEIDTRLGEASDPIEPPTDLSPANLLRPERGVAAFCGREPELADLRAWCQGDDHRPVRLLYGAGGAGKTRLARRLAEQLTQRGWECRFVRQDCEAEVVDLAVQAARQPVLLVVDYAETAAGLSRMLEAVTRSPDGTRLRVLLLARGTGEWWDRLEASTFRLREALAPALALAPGLRDGMALEEVVRQALRDFGRELQVAPPPQVEVVLRQDPPPVLVVHAAVLVALLSARDTAREPVRVVVELGVLDKLLRHEAVYWQHSAAPAGLTELDATTRRRMVALACIADVAGEAQAAALLTAVPDLRDSSAAVRYEAARWLRQLYEPASPGSWLGSLQPDLLAERHVVDQFAACPELADACVAGDAAAGQAQRALAVLARAMDHHDGAAAVIERLVTQHPAVVAAVIEAALASGERLAGLLTRILPGLSMPLEDVQRANAALHASTVLLAEVAVLLARRVLEALAPDADPLAAVACREQLARRLAQVGRSAEALPYNQEAVAICREHAALDPEGFGPALAAAANDLSVRLSEVGRTAEALPLGQEAVRLLRAANRSDQDHVPALAAALLNLGVWLWQTGRAREAVPYTGEAVTLYEDLVHTAAGRFVPEWAAALDNLGVQLHAIGQLDEAVRRSTLAVSLRARLAEASADQFAPETARTMTNHGMILHDAGRSEEAREMLRRAVAILRDLDRAHPGRFDQPLSRALHALSDVGGLDPDEQKAAERERLALSTKQTPDRPRAAGGFDPEASVSDSLLWIAGDPADDRVVRARLSVLARLDPPLRQDLTAVIRAIDQGTVDPSGTTMAPYLAALTAGSDTSESVEHAKRLLSQASQMRTLLAPTAQQGPEGDGARTEFARWALAAGNAAYDAGRGEVALDVLEHAANMAEIVVGHRPQNPDALRLGVETTIARATALTQLQHPSDAWSFTDQAMPIAQRWAELDARDPAPQAALSRMSAILGSTGMKVRPQPTATIEHPTRPGEIIPLDSAHFFGIAAVAQAQAALDLDPADHDVRQQVGQEAWHLGRHLEIKPAIPGLDHHHFAQVVLNVLTPTANSHPWLQSSALALNWANRVATSSTPG